MTSISSSQLNQTTTNNGPGIYTNNNDNSISKNNNNTINNLNNNYKTNGNNNLNNNINDTKDLFDLPPPIYEEPTIEGVCKNLSNLKTGKYSGFIKKITVFYPKKLSEDVEGLRNKDKVVGNNYLENLTLQELSYGEKLRVKIETTLSFFKCIIENQEDFSYNEASLKAAQDLNKSLIGLFELSRNKDESEYLGLPELEYTSSDGIYSISYSVDEEGNIRNKNENHKLIIYTSGGKVIERNNNNNENIYFEKETTKTRMSTGSTVITTEDIAEIVSFLNNDKIEIKKKKTSDFSSKPKLVIFKNPLKGSLTKVKTWYKGLSTGKKVALWTLVALGIAAASFYLAAPGLALVGLAFAGKGFAWLGTSIAGGVTAGAKIVGNWLVGSNSTVSTRSLLGKVRVPKWDRALAWVGAITTTLLTAVGLAKYTSKKPQEMSNKNSTNENPDSNTINHNSNNGTRISYVPTD